MTVATGPTLEHEIGAEGLLAVRLRDGEVRLRGVDGGAVRIREVNGRPLEEVFAIEAAAGSLSLTAGRTLEIVVGPRVIRRGLGGPTPELEIELPRRATLVLEAASGDVAAEGLLGDQRYRTASGDISLRAVSGRLSVEVVSGDVNLQATGHAAVSVRSMSGDIGLRAETLTALQVNTTSGDIGVAGRLAGAGPFAIETVSGDGLLAPIGDVRIEMTSLTGDLSSELDGRQASEHGRRSLSIGASGPLVTFRSLSGDLHVARSLPGGPPDSDGAPGAGIPSGAPSGKPAATAANRAIAAAYDDARLRILRSLERGEIDVAEAGRRLETLDAGDVQAPAADLVPTRDAAPHG